MATAAITPRDQLDRLLRLGRRALRYWWLIGIFGLVGGGAATAFAMVKKPRFLSETVVLYREIIPLSALQGTTGGRDLRDLGGRVRELLLARPRLEQVIAEFGLYPDKVKAGQIVDAVDEMRRTIQFRMRGSGTFHIGYMAGTPEQAEAVTARLAALLIAEDERLRVEQANVTTNFLKDEAGRAEDALNGKEVELAQFLTKHPEFAAETTGGATGGQAVRAAQARETRSRNTDPRLLALERQRERIRSRLRAPDAPAPARVLAPPSPERVAALGRVEAARRALESAREDLARNEARFTAAHPDVVAAKRRVQDGERRLREAEAAVPPLEEVESVRAATDPNERAALQADLDRIERDIVNQRRKSRDEQVVDAGNNWVVELETEWQRLQREVAEARERHETLEARLFSAQISASSELSGQSSQMEVIDPAYRPVRPSGAPKRLIVLAGLVLALGMGAALAVLLALVDDRLYDRHDLERLELAPVLIVVPGAVGKRGRKGKKSA